MRNKPCILITLHPRGKFSLGENRQCLQKAAYHWGILISPKDPNAGVHTHFDVTDSIYIDPHTGEVRDNWRFRERGDSKPILAFLILARVQIAKVPRGVGVGELGRRFSEIPLPRKEVDGDNCVSWVRGAIEMLSKMGALEEGFDVDKVMDDALGFADVCLREGRELGSVLESIRS
ncbi:hypothetical protein BDW59DRAFT_165601 [Aspergillus cavernicola]|uniref:Uncharacterized protein n=1 Tax=Aspergillus cavernicola TaxID=176166 RepID=A0ABR4HRN4_9EURO